MKVIVFGATGGTGKATVQELLDGGHQVTAFSRHAEELDIRSPSLHTYVGDAVDPLDVEKAITGHDAVVVALGVNDNPLKVRLLGSSTTPVNVCSLGTQHVIEAMKKLGLKKLVVVSAYGVGETRDRLPQVWRLLYRWVLRDQIADKERQERLVRQSGLDWVIVQPVGLTDRPAKAQILASPEGEARHNTIPRQNVGRFVAHTTVEPGAFIHRSVALS